MIAIVGVVVVLASVVIGFLMAGGELLVLIQISEFITIGGAAIGSLLISAPMSVLKKIGKAIPKVFASHTTSKDDYLKLLKSFYELFLVAQRDGLLAIEKHVEVPQESNILSVNEKFIKNEVALSFFCDTLKVIFAGGIPPHEVEDIMDISIETLENENKPVAGLIAKVGDSLPGLGIVAAALVGTFLGVLLSYGIVNPIAANVEHGIEEEIQYLRTIKASIISYTKGNPPIVAVEIARRTIVSDVRPSFQELESYLRGKKE